MTAEIIDARMIDDPPAAQFRVVGEGTISEFRYLYCNGCGNRLDGVPPRRNERAMFARQAGWHLVPALGWVCSGCIRCVHPLGTLLSGWL